MFFDVKFSFIVLGTASYARRRFTGIVPNFNGRYQTSVLEIQFPRIVSIPTSAPTGMRQLATELRTTVR